MHNQEHDWHACMQAEVTSEEAEALTRKLKLRFYRSCVKDNLNVSEGETDPQTDTTSTPSSKWTS